MATQLNPGADATLVAAAYRASMANVPQDYSKAFTAMAEGYATGVAGITAAIKPLVQGAFSEVAEGAQNLLKEAGEGIIKAVGTELTYKDHDATIADKGGEIPGYTEQEQALVDSDLWEAIEYNFNIPKLDKMSEDEVGKLQNRLLDAGYKLPKFGADKKMGPETKKAVEQAREDAKKLKETAAYAQSEMEWHKGRLEETTWMDDVEYEIDEGNKEGQKKASKIAKDADAEENILREGFAKEWETKLQERTKTLKTGSTLTTVDNNGQETTTVYTTSEDYITELKKQMVENNKKEDSDEKKKTATELDAKYDNLRKSEQAWKKQAYYIRGLLKNDGLNMEAMGGQAVNFMRALQQNGRTISGSGEVDGSSVMKGVDNEGNIVYTWVDKYNRPIMDKATNKPFSVSHNELGNYIVPKDAKNEVSLTTFTQEDAINAGLKGQKLNEREYINNIIKQIKYNMIVTFIILLKKSQILYSSSECDFNKS